MFLALMGLIVFVLPFVSGTLFLKYWENREDKQKEDLLKWAFLVAMIYIEFCCFFEITSFQNIKLAFTLHPIVLPLCLFAMLGVNAYLFLDCISDKTKKENHLDESEINMFVKICLFVVIGGISYNLSKLFYLL